MALRGGAQLVAHRRQEARLGEIGFFRFPPGLVGIGVGRFQLRDQRVLFGAEGDGRDRADIETVGEEDEEQLRRRGHHGGGQAVHVGAAPEIGGDADHDRHDSGIDRHGDRGGEHHRQRADDQQRRRDEDLGPGRIHLREDQQHHRPTDAVEALRQREGPAPGPDRNLAHGLRQKAPAQNDDDHRGQQHRADPGRDPIDGHPEAGGGGHGQRQNQRTDRAVHAVLGENPQQLVVEGALEAGRGGQPLAHRLDLAGDELAACEDRRVRPAPALHLFGCHFRHDRETRCPLPARGLRDGPAIMVGKSLSSS